MCSDVPKASPGTTTTWASVRSRAARSEAVRMPPLPKKALHVGVDVEGAFRDGAGEAGDGLEAVEDRLAKLDVVGAHLGDALLRSR